MSLTDLGDSYSFDKNDVRPGDSCALEFLEKSEIQNAWLHPDASNYTFVVALKWGDIKSYGVYKPERGEAPLTDFPQGLYKREIAAYFVSEALAWELVPPTIVRLDESVGFGSMQLFVPPVEGSNFFNLRDDHSETVKLIALFDWVINNADRKGGHCFLADSGGVWAIDNGLSFHEEHKLRTVIWDFAEQEIDSWMLQDLRRFQSELNVNTGSIYKKLSELLEASEIDSLKKRITAILANPFYPKPRSRRDIPWPII